LADEAGDAAGVGKAGGTMTNKVRGAKPRPALQQVANDSITDAEWLVALLKNSGYSPCRAIHALLSAIVVITIGQKQEEILSEPLDELVGHFAALREYEIEHGPKQRVQ
jgi:hypothetical protein